jgi:D-psicose/D-tagatose/L-ribulose 3-epimerase
VIPLAISNIAWETRDDRAVAELLHRYGVGGVEIAPTKWRERPLEASSADVAAYRRYWGDLGLQIVSLQSLLFGRPDLQLFGDARVREATRDYLRRLIAIGGALGAHTLVFGSPKNRRRGAMPANDAMRIACDFLLELAGDARSCGVTFCVEANPPAYDCDFITTTPDAVALCEMVGEDSVRINADLGGMTIAREDPARTIGAAGPFIGHVHASEPNLAELGAEADHDAAGAALAAIGYAGWVSIEMRAAGGGEALAAIQRAVVRAQRAYNRSE